VNGAGEKNTYVAFCIRPDFATAALKGDGNALYALRDLQHKMMDYRAKAAARFPDEIEGALSTIFVAATQVENCNGKSLVHSLRENKAVAAAIRVSPDSVLVQGLKR
jgi:hypothetical protein